MAFLRSHGLPVPRIFDYSATPHNPIGTEYILMEIVQGRELSEIWLHLTPQERIKLVSQIVEMEALLFLIRLPTNGSIYHSRDLEPEVERINISATDESGDFCFGPDCHYRWWYRERASLPVGRGPCETL